MQNYLSYEEYVAYGLNDMGESEFNALSTYVSRLIDAYTFQAIPRYDLMSDEYYASMVRDAMAFQMDFMSRIGKDEALGTGEGAGARKASESETIGNYSHSVSYGSDTSSKEGVSVQTYVGTMQLASLTVTTLAPIRAMGRRLSSCSRVI